MDQEFAQLWSSVLEDCEVEHIPHAKLTSLARRAGPAELAYLLAEASRVHAEAQALRSQDVSDDVTDDLWRIATCLSEIVRKRGPEAARFLVAELQNGDSLHRPSAARLLGTVAQHADRAELSRLCQAETDAAVREELTQILQAPRRPRPWWQFWNRGQA